jgi:aspartyl-tRNA(Asn)/glutamyl-tRNA(Gln) amidotransferase subunit A
MQPSTISRWLPSSSGLAAYADDLRKGVVTATAATAAYLDRIQRVNPVLNAYVHIASESAMRQAHEIDALLAQGKDLGPLMGVPIAVKDNIVVAGMPTRAGSNVIIDDLLGLEGSLVQTLRQAGCIILGKVHTVEFAMGSAGTNYAVGAPRNPRDMTQARVAGGSSSGSAVAVAAGLCGFALGSDTGGSIRMPAAFCGVVGFKPSRSAWERDGVFPLSRNLDALGILSADTADAQYIWEALSGTSDVVDHASLEGLRIGVPKQFFQYVDPVIDSAVRAACDRFAEAGAKIIDVDLAEFDEWNKRYVDVCDIEFLADFGEERFRHNAHMMNADVQQRLQASLVQDFKTYELGLLDIKRWRQEANNHFTQVDLWLGPTKQNLPPALPATYEPDRHKETIMRCIGPTRFANVLDLAALSLPIATETGSLPTGLQLAAPAAQASWLLSIAAQMELTLGAYPRAIFD